MMRPNAFFPSLDIGTDQAKIRDWGLGADMVMLYPMYRITTSTTTSRPCDGSMRSRGDNVLLRAAVKRPTPSLGQPNHYGLESAKPGPNRCSGSPPPGNGRL